MVEIAVGLDESRCLKQLSLSGHAGYGTVGSDPACAAITLMARSIARLVRGRTGWTVDGTAAAPGNLFLDIQSRPEDTDEWLAGVTDTLLLALADIEREFPGSISVSLEEKYHGS